MTSIAAKEPSWHAALPLPLSVIEGDNLVTSAVLYEKMMNLKRNEGMKADFLVVDVRRTDFEDCFIAGAVNLPAQSFHQTLPSLLPILTQYKQVIFHCSSSNGRGPRIASYYQDALNARGITISQAAVLVGGVKEFSAKYGEDVVCKL